MPKVIGLHLWEVVISDRREITHLWITTRNNSAETAAHKAAIVIRRDGYRGKIERIDNCGTIDA